MAYPRRPHLSLRYLHQAAPQGQRKASFLNRVMNMT
jgi:hypothetical protein